MSKKRGWGSGIGERGSVSDPRSPIPDLRSSAFCLFLWTLCWLIYFWPLLTRQAHLPLGDFAGQFFAFGQLQAQEMVAGRWPLWSPHSYGGVPFAADTQAAVFYPPRWRTIWLNQGLSYYALQLEGLLHIWLAGAGVWGLVTHATRNRWAGLFSSVAFGLGGYVTSYPLLQLALLETVAWLPLALLFVRLAVFGERPFRWLAAAGLTLGMAQLAGHPQSWLHIVSFTAVYALFLMLNNGWQWRRIVTHGLLLGSIAIGVSAVAWLPTLRFLPYTVRSDVDYAFVAAGFPLLNYLQLVAPRAVSFWAPEYVGIPALLLAVLAWQQRRGLGREVTFWGVSALVAAWLSLGDKGILFEGLYWLAPPFRLFRQQERLVVLLVLSLSVLAGYGFAAWQNVPVHVRRRWLKQTAVFGALFLLVAGLFLSQMGSDDWLLIWGRTTAVFATMILWLRWLEGDWWGNGRFIIWLLPLLLVDLLGVRGAMALQPNPPDTVREQPAWVAQVDQTELGRIDSGLLLTLNLGELTGLEDVRGISPLKPNWLAQYEQINIRRRWQLLNVTHQLSTVALDEMTLVAELESAPLAGNEQQLYLYQIAETLPRARLVYALETVATEDEALVRLKDDAFDLVNTAVTHTPPANLPTLSPPNERPFVQTTRLSPRELQVEVITAVPAVLVVSEWNFPGWRVTVDGKAVEHFNVNAGQIGAVVPAGTHTVQVQYQLAGLATGVAISAVTLLVALVLLVFAKQITDNRQQITDNNTSRSQFTIFSSQEKNRSRSRIRSRSRVGKGSAYWPILLVFAAIGVRLVNLAGPELRPAERIVWYMRFRPFEWPLPLADVELAYRLPSVLLSVVAVGLLVGMLRRLRLGMAGWFTAVLFALAPFTVQASQDARPLYWVLLNLLLLAALLLTVPKLKWLGWLLLGTMLLSPLYLQPIRQHNALPIAATSLELATFLTNAGHTLLVGLFLDVVWLRWVWLLAVGTAVYGLRTLHRTRPKLATFIALWTTILPLAQFLLQFNNIYFEEISLILIAPTFYFSLFTGLRTLYNQTRPHKVAALLLSLSLLAIAVWGTTAAFTAERTLGYAQLATLIDEQVAQTNEAVVMVSEKDAAMQFYANQPIERALPSFFEEQLMGRTAVSFIHTDLDDPFPNILEDWSWLRVSRQQVGNFYLSYYTHKSLGAPSLQTPHKLGDTITLDGTHITQSPHHSITPSPLRVNLFWATEAVIAEPYTVFVQLLDANGMLVSQHDGVPVSGNAPTTIWQPDIPYLDIHELDLPPDAPRPLTLIVGMYHSETIERLTFDTGEDALVIETIE